MRRYIQKRPSGLWKKQTRLQVRAWRGFKVEIWNNGSRHRLHYEWKIYPLRPHMKKVAASRSRRHKILRVIRDHTSTYNMKECWLDAKVRVNETRAFNRLLNVDAYLARASM